MTEKRFKVVDDFKVVDNTTDWHTCSCCSNLEADVMCNLLNELNDENNHIKQTIQEAYNNERTAIGKSVLKQLLEAIQ